MMKGSYVLVAGGTGGHLFPAISLAKALKEAGKKVVLFTDERAFPYVKEPNEFDKIIINNFGFNSYRGKLRKVLFYCKLMFCGLKNLAQFIINRPKIVIGFGCYSSAPTIFAAQLLGIPTVLHEQNSIIGRANFFLQKMARCVATGFETVANLDKKKQIYVGNPVRKNIMPLIRKDYLVPDSNFNIFILGGSQGADLFSEVIPKSFRSLPLEMQKRIKICHQVRKENLVETKILYRESISEFELKPFFDNIDEIYDWAHLIISRGGASSLSEISIVGLPAILIPLAKTLDSDQLYNARYYEKNGACVVVEEKDLNAKDLGKLIEKLINNGELLKNMSVNSRKLATPDATSKLLEAVINF